MILFELLRELETMEVNCDLQMNIAGIRNDSRTVEKGDIFVAVKGYKEDGNAYIESAIEKGAAVIVSEEPVRCPHIIVPDSKEALSRLAAAFYGHPSRKLSMIGVTGTKGKTTVTHAVNSLLGKGGLIGTNHILIGDKEFPAERTTPDAVSLHRAFKDMEGLPYCVMEVSSHALSQKRTASIQYSTAAFTNLTRDHLDYHKDMEDYFQAKRILFKQCNRAVINIDDDYGRRLFEEKLCPVSGISLNDKKAEFYGENIVLHPEKVEFTVNNKPMVFNTPGRFSVYNALTAIGIAISEGLSLSEVSERLIMVPSVMGRMETLNIPADFTVIIDYAHTPDALLKVLTTVKETAKGRIITLFGCGGDRDSGKRSQMGDIAEKYSDMVVVTSDNPRTENPMDIIKDICKNIPAPTIIENRREAVHYALSAAEKDDIVLLCGKGHELYQEINGEKFHMDEREIVNEFFAEGNI